MAERHPVADLLTDEMRARVRATPFVRHKHRVMKADILGKVAGRWSCPLGVALGVPGSPSPGAIADRLGVSYHSNEGIEIRRFTRVVDFGLIDDPADVYVMLGCEPAEARP